MKKNTLLLALTLILLLAGCGQSAASPQLPEADPAPAVENAPAPSEEQTPQGETEPEPTALPEAEPTAPEVDPPAPSSDSSETNPVPAEAKKPETTKAPAETEVPAEAEVPSKTEAPTPEITTAPEPVPTPETSPAPEIPPEPETASSTVLSGTDLTLRFGGGESFSIHMYDNPTASKIAEYVGTASWQLPIYHFDDYDGWEQFQYYDIPSRYDIPDGSQTVTSEKAGTVYYSHPNRIILFYQDGAVSTEYTPVGYIDFSQSLVDAVENNPVVEGWGNKLVWVE